MQKGIMDERALEGINAEVLSQVQEAVEYALESPLPDPEDALEDIFSM
jgi:TPP-dependent pyruvate/acetoin dehydrogenase alpha subunit